MEGKVKLKLITYQLFNNTTLIGNKLKKIKNLEWSWPTKEL